jgi:hypothetical protein
VTPTPTATRESNPELREGVAGISPVAATGVLEVQSDPAGARVTIDGKPHGSTPLTVPLPFGPHVVAVSDGRTTTTRTMNTTAGGTSTLVAALSPASPVGATGGWLSIGSPVELQVREGSSILGITSAERLMLPSGHHELEVGSTTLGVQQRVSVDIQPGKITKATVTVPNGSLSVNAVPWANVWLDGQPLTGTTPFANVAVPLGTHEVIYRHPQFGERRDTVLVTAKSPVRLVKDLRK